MRSSTAYFVGAGTIVAAIAIGLGGGLIAGNIMHPVAPKIGPDTSKLESPVEPVATTSAPSDRVQYLTGTTAFGTAVAPTQAETQAKPQTANIEPQAAQPAQPVAANESAPATPPAPVKSADRSPDRSLAKPAEKQAVVEPKVEQKIEAKTEANKTEAKVEAKAEAKTEAKAEAKPVAADPVATPENAFAKAKDTDVKRANSERRRAERRRDWTERRHYEARGRTDWDDVARNIREDSDARETFSARRSYPPPDRGPQIRLFDFGDD